MTQCADAVLMIRPSAFGWNPETEGSNRFQRRADLSAPEATARARSEFDRLARALADAGVVVHACDDRPSPPCPDAVFPNNWLSCHADGTVVLYPMLAPNRRRERRPDLVARLVADGPYHLRRTVDLTHYEARGEFLEGTGSLVLDHEARVAYACLSPRTHAAPLADFCAQLGYTACTFVATDAAGVPVYHTNVVLAVGVGLAVVALDSIAAADRDRVLEALGRGGRHVEIVDRAQAAGFAANVLQLRDGRGGTVLAMSAQAAASFGPDAMQRLAGRVSCVVAVPIPTIETLGGGSVRCMLCEVFLPRGIEP